MSVWHDDKFKRDRKHSKYWTWKDACPERQEKNGDQGVGPPLPQGPFLEAQGKCWWTKCLGALGGGGTGNPWKRKKLAGVERTTMTSVLHFGTSPSASRSVYVLLQNLSEKMATEHVKTETTHLSPTIPSPFGKGLHQGACPAMLKAHNLLCKSMTFPASCQPSGVLRSLS